MVTQVTIVAELLTCEQYNNACISTHIDWSQCTVWRKILTGENIDEFPTIRQYFPIKILHLATYQ